MQQVSTVSELRALRKDWFKSNDKVAFVPTMGNLHEGHLDLVRRAQQIAQKVIVSIFVNPMQFGAHEDLAAYPRSMREDLQKLSELGVAAVFTPSVKVMYPQGTDTQTKVSVPTLSRMLCGASRPGHFDGVATVVCKLFNLVQPDIACFGLKDYQQLLVIRALVKDLCLPIELEAVPTAREANGLALSSRNSYLTAEEQKIAPIIYQSLIQIKQDIQAGIALPCALQVAQETWLQNGIRPDYIEIRRQQDLQLPGAHDQELIALAAGYLGQTRLIDNLAFTKKPVSTQKAASPLSGLSYE